jgi:hypothetical protein
MFAQFDMPPIVLASPPWKVLESRRTAASTLAWATLRFLAGENDERESRYHRSDGACDPKLL